MYQSCIEISKKIRIVSWFYGFEL